MNTKENHIDFSTVLASSVHDMKNSVGMLLASVESILEEHEQEIGENNKHFRTLHYEASRINGELIQLLTLYRMDSGFLPVNVDEHYVIDVFEDQVARNQPLLDTSRIDMQVHCNHDLLWYFDTDLIGGVIHNVLVNCIRYTDTRIRLSATEADNMLCVEVCDNGPGYPDDMLEDPSTRVYSAEVSKGATQLGLFFAQNIAQLHRQGDRRGRIELCNGGALGGGVFRLLLP